MIVPFFVSHAGCPHRCIFCDQRAISGSGGGVPDAATIRRTIDRFRLSAGSPPVEVAFFGGSFTSLPRRVQEHLLDPLQEMLADGRVGGVRVSTRPDAMEGETARFLRERGVGTVELGVQSLDDRVLAAAGRGHTAEQVAAACARLRAAGLRVGLQLMVGLPEESASSSLATVRGALALSPDFLRLYPVLVLADTPLAGWYRAGSYRPLGLDEAVGRCKVMLHAAERAGVPVIRVGLQPTGELSRPGAVVAGPYHPAFRQLAEGERWYDLFRSVLAGFSPAERERMAIHCAPKRVSDVIGLNRRNRERLSRRLAVRQLAVLPDSDLSPTAARVMAGDVERRVDLLADLHYTEETFRA